MDVGAAVFAASRANLRYSPAVLAARLAHLAAPFRRRKSVPVPPPSLHSAASPRSQNQEGLIPMQRLLQPSLRSPCWACPSFCHPSYYQSPSKCCLLQSVVSRAWSHELYCRHYLFLSDGDPIDALPHRVEIERYCVEPLLIGRRRSLRCEPDRVGSAIRNRCGPRR